MDTNNTMIKTLEAKIKLLEIENEKLSSTIELNNKEITQIRNLIKSLSEANPSPIKELTPNPGDKIINLNFNWKKNENAFISKDLKSIKKIKGGSKWNCTALGDNHLIKGKINSWKIQFTKKTGDIVFGIVPKGIDINAIDNWRKGYATCAGNFAKHNLGIWVEFAKHQAVEGNIFEIKVDLEKENGELSFYVNGNFMGIFCQNIINDIEYIPFIDIHEEGTEITLI